MIAVVQLEEIANISAAFINTDLIAPALYKIGSSMACMRIYLVMVGSMLGDNHIAGYRHHRGLYKAYFLIYFAKLAIIRWEFL